MAQIEEWFGDGSAVQDIIEYQVSGCLFSYLPRFSFVVVEYVLGDVIPYFIYPRRPTGVLLPKWLYVSCFKLELYVNGNVVGSFSRAVCCQSVYCVVLISINFFQGEEMKLGDQLIDFLNIFF